MELEWRLPGSSEFLHKLSSFTRLIRFDKRGTGLSDPVSGAPSLETRMDDVRAVMDALDLKRPVLVGWSYAGRVIEDYLEAYGTARIAGINYVCARTNNQPAFVGPGHEHFPAMLGADKAAERAATLAFVRACFARQPSPEMLERILDYNMLVAPHIRAAHLARPPSDGAILATIDVPVLVTQGEDDLLVTKGLGELTATLVPGARLSMYRGVGHSPFAEDTGRFNRELAEFAAAAHDLR